MSDTQSTAAAPVGAPASARRWARLIPVAFITYSFAYVDRANFSFGTAGGQAQELGLGGDLTAFLSATFFLGYFLFQIPGAHYAEHRSARKLIFWSLILWGALAAATGFVSNVVLLFLVRFFLGVVESAVLPAMLILLSHWFTREERSRANSFLILGNPITVLWMSVLSGYLVHSFGWRGMFIAEGIPAIIWAFIWLPLVRDRPEPGGLARPGREAGARRPARAGAARAAGDRHVCGKPSACPPSCCFRRNTCSGASGSTASSCGFPRC